MRILVDQSGYDLLNIGDVAMLQACLSRLRMQWPDAEIMVIAHEPARLASYCPEARAITRPLAGHPLLRCLPRKPLLASEQAWKIAGPYMRGRVTSGRAAGDRPGPAIQAVQAADLVVASGGGYLTDSWWWHAAGVLSLLSLAQRLGKPTAMFGQGLGPITQRALQAKARAVFPRLAVLGLRESELSEGLALELGARPSAVTVTGDDALAVIPDKGLADGQALGVNLRVAGYSRVDPSDARAISSVLQDSARDLGAPIELLPVSRQPADSDVAAVDALIAAGSADDSPGGLPATEALAASAAKCRAIVTGSYHAAVFGLAQGVPAICLTKSAYYDAKFAGLKALFPAACSVLPVGESDFASRLTEAIACAWRLPRSAREAALHSAISQRESGRKAYTHLRETVVMADGPVR